jgi:hypothetical protein
MPNLTFDSFFLNILHCWKLGIGESGYLSVWIRTWLSIKEYHIFVGYLRSTTLFLNFQQMTLGYVKTDSHSVYNKSNLLKKCL